MDVLETIRAYELAQEVLKGKAKQSFAHFVQYIKEDYDMQWFHRVICDKLQRFADGEIRKMMILVPPQHGKSELATRMLPGYLLGRNPELRIGVASYAQTIASGFNRAIQRNIDNERYGEIFPDTKLNGSQIFKTNVGQYARTSHKFEIINHLGSVKTVGRGGSLTSEPLDIGIIDDLYKDRAEAKSPAISEKAFEWYNDVFKTRFHNDSQQLIMNTRWDEFDLAGRLLVQEPLEWEIIKFKGIKEDDIYDYDPRETGEALWPEKHSLARLLDIKAKNETGFNSLYQQDPKAPASLLVYPNVYEVEILPALEPNYWGVDFGYGNSPSVIVKGCFDERNSYYDECSYETSLTAQQMKAIFTANGYKTGQPVACDHDKDMINQLRMLGINAFEAHKSIAAGVLKMTERKIHITKRSQNARKEANNLKYKTFAGLVTNEIEPGGDHFWDGARYLTVAYSFLARK